MRWEWAGRWGGAACAVAGCMPMLAAFAAGLSGAAGAGAAAAAGGMAAGMGMAPAVGAAPAVPGWVSALGSLSWPLLLGSAALLVASFWRTPPLPRAVAYAGVAVLLANQMHMRGWLFFPGMALEGAAFALAWAGRRHGAQLRPGAGGLRGLSGG
jgi:hypothetical protein